MSSYVVTVEQRWSQRVRIEGVASRREALVAARKGDYTINEDPKYERDIDPLGWKVEETDDNP